VNRALSADPTGPEAESLVDSPLEFDALRRLSEMPSLTQRQLSSALGSSLGRTNFVVQALLKKGLVKVRRFRNSNNKWAYAYLLTPDGWRIKATMTRQFLRMKLDEYESLREEIEALRRESQADGAIDE
jgi:EPS-associated MarR family transcriptional regulator